MGRKRTKHAGRKRRETGAGALAARLKTPLATSLGAVNFVLLEGAGGLREEQKRFLGVAKKHLELAFFDLEKERRRKRRGRKK